MLNGEKGTVAKLKILRGEEHQILLYCLSKVFIFSIWKNLKLFKRGVYFQVGKRWELLVSYWLLTRLGYRPEYTWKEMLILIDCAYCQQQHSKKTNQPNKPKNVPWLTILRFFGAGGGWWGEGFKDLNSYFRFLIWRGIILSLVKSFSLSSQHLIIYVKSINFAADFPKILYLIRIPLILWFWVENELPQSAAFTMRRKMYFNICFSKM